MRKKYAVLLLVLPLLWYACKNAKTKRDIQRDTSITERTSFNNLFLDSTALHAFMESHKEFAAYEDQYADFYKERNYEYAWFDSSGLAEQSHSFINLLNSSISELQDSSLYNADLYKLYEELSADAAHHKKLKEVLQTELFFTGQFFAYAAKVYKGSDIDAAELGWFIPRKKVNLTALLDSVIQSKGKEPEQYVHLNAQYKSLQEQLSKYFSIEKKEAWDSLAKPERKYQLHDSLPVIKRIKQRLFLLGDLAEADTTNLFDTTLVSGVKSFQRRMGLSADGVIGPKVMDEINYPIKQRIQQLLVNLERARWMPPQDDSVFILVNIPEFKLHVFDSAQYKFSMNVIVGSAANNTVIFTGKLKYIVFSPYWNVPPSIIKKEIIPGIKNDPHYIAKHNMEITGYNKGEPVAIRQKPGPTNSLGLVKFLFPNSYDIYLHDTPNRDLFSQSGRGLSHGCIRIAEPKKMAQFLLRSDTTWTSGKIDSAMNNTKEKWVTIPKTVPVFITYFTAWVDRFGKLNFRKDIYNHDQKMADKLFAKQ